MLRLYSSIIILLGSLSIYAQSTTLPFHHIDYHLVDRWEIKTGQLSNAVFTSSKPYFRKGVVDLIRTDSLPGVYSSKDRINNYYVLKDNNEWNEDTQYEYEKPILKHFYKYKTDFFFLNRKDLMFKLNPVLQFHIGADSDSETPRFINSRGFEFRGWVDEKVGFYVYVTDNQARYQNFADSWIKINKAVPGENDWKEAGKTGAVDYFQNRGYITFSPTKHITFQLGHDHNFIGNGYRSLLLSDFSAPYFFGKISTQVWKLNFTNLWSQQIQTFDPTDGNQLLPRKYTATQHVSYNVTRWLNLGLFETVIYERDGLDINYFNPVIFLKPLENSVGSPDNAIIGADFKVNFLRSFSAYGQLMLDEFNISKLREEPGWWANKYGGQLGLKYIDVAGIVNLDLQAELNAVRPYTYSHSNTAINYTHYNQPLAHPLGANFKELILIGRYKPLRKLDVELKWMLAEQGLSTDTLNLGENIFLSNTDRNTENNNEIGQGINTQINNLLFRASYQPFHNIYVDFIFQTRAYTIDLDNIDPNHFRNNYVGFGLRTNMAFKEFMF